MRSQSRVTPSSRNSWLHSMRRRSAMLMPTTMAVLIAVPACSSGSVEPPSPRSTAVTTDPRPIPGDNSQFLAETVPDGTQVKVNQIFDKAWELKNVGSVVWSNRYLTREGEAEGSGVCTTERSVQITETAPGGSVTIRVQVTAPSMPSVCHVIWKMTDAGGRQFFPDRDGIWFDVIVIR
jgi:hypothetical protein